MTELGPFGQRVVELAMAIPLTPNQLVWVIVVCFCGAMFCFGMALRYGSSAKKLRWSEQHEADPDYQDAVAELDRAYPGVTQAPRRSRHVPVGTIW